MLFLQSAAFNKAYSDFLFHTCSGGKSLPKCINHPLPLTTDQSLEVKAILSVLTSMFLLMPFCLIPGAFVIFVVKEKACKSKHLQLVSGCNIGAYWIGNYIWDISVYSILSILSMCMFLVYGRDSAEVFVGDMVSFSCTMALIFGYGLSVMPFSYIIARNFR
jgi:ATP-binding cassette, subfamily A (ABC1), member 3